jgi:hypothetical protein
MNLVTDEPTTKGLSVVGTTATVAARTGNDATQNNARSAAKSVPTVVRRVKNLGRLGMYSPFQEG